MEGALNGLSFYSHKIKSPLASKPTLSCLSRLSHIPLPSWIKSGLGLLVRLSPTPPPSQKLGPTLSKLGDAENSEDSEDDALGNAYSIPSSPSISELIPTQDSRMDVDLSFWELSDIVELVEEVDETTCHQCQQRTSYDKMHCTHIFEDVEKCRLRFCVRCIFFSVLSLIFDFNTQY